MSDLSKAIDNFYLAFSELPIPYRIEACPCCLDAKSITRLLATPLRKLRAEELAAYASSALLTVGNTADYLYFLPRILEISISGSAWLPNIEATARAIHATNVPAWPQHRRMALMSLVESVMENIVQTKQYPMIDAWLCSISRMGLAVHPFLAIIAADTDAVLSYFDENAHSLHLGKLSNCFWSLPNQGHDDILQWFHSEPIRAIPFEAYGYMM